MSKPVPNVEIEDVLSSIRRLVSTSDRVERKASEIGADTSDKLVLTPSLRVDEVSDNDVSDTDQTFEEQTVTAKVPEETPLDDEISEHAPDRSTAEIGFDADDEFLAFVKETDISEGEPVEANRDPKSDADNALRALESILSEGAESGTDVEEETGTTDGSGEDGADADLTLEPTDGPAAKDENSDRDGEKNLQRRAAEFETIVAQKVDQWDPDGTTQDENAAVSGGPVPWQDEDEPPEDDAAMLDDPLSIFDSDEQSAAEDEVEAVSDELAAAEADNDLSLTEALSLEDEPENSAAEEVSKRDDAEQQDSEDDESDTAQDEALLLDAESMPFEFRSHATAALQGALNASVEREFAEATPVREEALLDEDTLRDMVSDIVRQELQGALGERITRNVRKLVRREIHRALASRELD